MLLLQSEIFREKNQLRITNDIDFHVIITIEKIKGEIVIPLLSEDFAAFHIENFLTMTDVYCGLYD